MAGQLIKFISMEEFRKMFKAEKDKKVKMALVLGFGSGLRISEIVGYKREDGSFVPPLTSDRVDLQAHQIRVENAKGRKDRITVTSPLLNESSLKLLPIEIPRRTLQRRVESLGKRVLGKKITFHQFRHGFANYMVNEKNVPLPMVQQMMGHSRLDTTGIYTRSNPKLAIDSAWGAWE